MVIAKAFPAFVKWCRSKSSGWSRSGPKHEHEFLPAALEILETPPSPTGRMVALLLCCLFLIALVWSFLGRIDVNATASAQLVPIGGVKTIQSLETAVVRRILVDNGQTVVKGDLLVELDTTENATDISQLRNERARAKEDFYRYAAFLAEIADDSLALGASENAVLDTLAGQVRNGKSGAHGISPSDDASMIGTLPDKQKRLLLAKLAAYQAKRTSLDAQIRESDAVIRSSRHEVRSLRNRLALLETKASALKKMVDRHGDARLQWLEVKQEREETRDKVAIEHERALQAQASNAHLRAASKQYQAETVRDVLSKAVEARDTIVKNALDIERHRERERHRYLRAPVTGSVQELQVRTVGGVVQPAQALMIVVPHDAPMAFDAKILNQDIGFVRPGQSVRLKVDSFPYTKYGVLNGTVRHLSSDATPDEDLGLVYMARIDVDGDMTTARGTTLPLRVGMAATAEIRTDNRRVIDFLLSPIKAVANEAFRER